MSSLADHRISTLESSNAELQEQLDLLIRAGFNNEQKFVWLQTVILALLDVDDVDDLDHVLSREFIDRPDVDESMLFLQDFDLNNSYKHIQGIEKDHPLARRLTDLTAPTCETTRREEYEELFRTKVEEPGSVALIPIFEKDLRGVLAIGSRDHSRFNLAMDTLFLNFLGEVLGRVARRI